MATIKGENLRIMLIRRSSHGEPNLRCIAASTSCVVHVAAQVEEDTTKDVVDDWLNKEVVGLNWDVRVDALVVDNTDDIGQGAYRADELVIGKTYDLYFKKTTGAPGMMNRDDDPDAPSLSGKAILSDLQINSQNGEIATYTAQFTGSSDLHFT